MNKSKTKESLSALGLNKLEAAAYVALLKKPTTHAQLSIVTGINRTTLYRVITRLQQRDLVTIQADDRGKILLAADPATLEVDIINQEVLAQQRRIAFERLLPELEAMQAGPAVDFVIKTYSGVDGFKRMLWHELKTQGDCLCIGTGTLEDLVESRQWSENHRQLSVEAGYVVREIGNPGDDPGPAFSANENFMHTYQRRIIPTDMLKVNYIITTYNSTVAIYHISQGHRRGLEIISKLYAETVRSMFEFYWKLGEPVRYRESAS